MYRGKGDTVKMLTEANNLKNGNNEINFKGTSFLPSLNFKYTFKTNEIKAVFKSDGIDLDLLEQYV